MAVVEDASHIFEWSNEKKAQLVVYFSAFMGAYALLGVAVLHVANRYYDLSAYVNNDNVTIGVVAACGYVAAAIYLVHAGNQVLASGRKNEFYVFMGILYYLVGNTALLYYMGFHSLMMGIYVSGSSTVGILLFGKRVVMPIIYLTLVLGMGLYAMSLLGLVPYAALVADPGNNHNNLIWLTAVSNMAVPHVAMFIFIANVSVNRWREREQRAKYLSQTDVLTDCANRRYFIEQLYQHYADVQKHGGTFSLLMMDLGSFKNVNETYGHYVGDQLLIAASEALKGCIRTKDILGRYGGAEFVLLLPNTEAPAAQISAQRCAERVASQRFLAPNQQELTLQIAIGCVTTSAATMQHPPEYLLWLADEALIEAKLSGKNRVVANNQSGQQPSIHNRHSFRVI